MIEFIVFLICTLYPVSILIYYAILTIEWIIVRKRIWELGKMTLYRVIFIQAILPLFGLLLYHILPGSIDYTPSYNISERHVNTVGALLLLLTFGCVVFAFTFHRERKKHRINLSISKKARRKDLRNHKKMLLG